MWNSDFRVTYQAMKRQRLWQQYPTHPVLFYALFFCEHWTCSVHISATETWTTPELIFKRTDKHPFRWSRSTYLVHTRVRIVTFTLAHTNSKTDVCPNWIKPGRYSQRNDIFEQPASKCSVTTPTPSIWRNSCSLKLRRTVKLCLAFDCVTCLQRSRSGLKGLLTLNIPWTAPRRERGSWSLKQNTSFASAKALKTDKSSFTGGLGRRRRKSSPQVVITLVTIILVWPTNLPPRK